MKATLLTLLAVGLSAPAFSATYLPDSLKTSSLKYWFDFTTNTQPVTSWNANGTPANYGTSWGGSQNFVRQAGQYATLGSGAVPWSNLSGYSGASGMTISFDMNSLVTGAWADIVSLNTSAGIFKLEQTGVSSQLAFYGTASDIYLPTLSSSLKQTSDWTTVTITLASTGVSIYANGQLAASNTVDLSSLNITGIQFGQEWGGARPITSANIDNVGIWNTAMTAGEVAQLTTVPEPATATLGALGLAALLLRRRRRSA